MAIIEGTKDARGLRVTLVVARFNDFVTERLQRGALEALTTAGAREADISIVHVPGSFELPLAAQVAASSGEVDAVVCLGCLIKGETVHFEYIASAVAHGITAAAAVTGVPIAFGVLTTDSAEQALARAGAGSANKGWEAAMAAVEMATLFRKLRRRAPEGIRV
ncbi:MAG: 6,7-dimethyl-8-ribityllumazine synthase [Acidobacteria bacterium]|nr:6,7-dimethyl-8-ribityllumazine synthase [Acidobacteriota bacterium]